MAKTIRHPLRVLAACVASVLLALAAGAQTPIELQKNSYTPQQDVELGREAAAQVRRELPMLKDGRVESFVQGIGNRLIEQIPAEFRHPGFQYTFEVVNLKDINAFALPGGPMFLHRGMIEAAQTDAQVAGVMAHELSHVVLRHGTVQASRGQKFQIGALAGQILGAIVGGKTGAVIAQGSEIGLGTYFLKYGREFEREADLLGAQIMARAGYHPREMASMFETIERQGGARGPEWLSSHPNPGNRVAAINEEAQMLRVAPDAPSSQIQSVHARLAQMPAAQTMEQVQKARQTQRGPEPVATGGRRNVRVEPPSRQWRAHQPGEFLQLSVPANWHALQGEGGITYAPEGGYVRAPSGQSAFTHGLQVGVAQVQGGTLQQKTDQLLQGFAQANPRLRRQGGYSRATISGRAGLTTKLTNQSDVNGQAEAISVSTVELRDGSVLFLIGVAPTSEARVYSSAFNRVRQSVRLADR